MADLCFHLVSVCVLICSVLSDSWQPHWTVACQVPLSVDFPRQEYWSGLPFPPPEDLANPEIKPGSPTGQAESLLSDSLLISTPSWITALS